MSVSIILFTQTSKLVIVNLLCLFMLSLCAGLYVVPLYAIVQHRCMTQYIGRVIAANNVMNALFMVCASVFALIIFSLGFSVVELFLSIAVLNVLIYFILHILV